MGEDDITIDMQYCGICHSDVHIAQNELGGGTLYPCVPGHELAGLVVSAGKNALADFPVGSKVGVGCIVESCLNCTNCKEGHEQMCEGGGFTHTYSAKVKHNLHGKADGERHTYGGYTEKFVIDRRFAIPIPAEYPLEKAGPVFCAGVTLWHPLKYSNALGGGKKIAIAGLGGLGQMGLRLAVAMGNEVSVISTSENKKAKALEMGATNFILIDNAEQVEQFKNYFHLILNTISANHSVVRYQDMLKNRGNLVMMGLIPKPIEFRAMSMLTGDKGIQGSSIGSVSECKEVIEFCTKNKIYLETKEVVGDQIDDVYKQLTMKNDDVTRYVLNIKKSSQNESEKM